MKKLLLTILSICMFTTVFSQVGGLDPTYGNNGIKVIVPPVTPPSGPPSKTYPADDGGYYAIYDNYIVKYLKEGTVNVLYGDSGFVVFSKSINKSFDFEGTVRQADGRITVVGDAGDGIDIIRYHVDGTLDFYEKYGDFGELDFYQKYVETVTLQDDKVVITGTQHEFHPNSLLYFVYVLHPEGWIEYLSPDYQFFTTDYTIIDGNEHYIYEGWLSNPHPPITYVLSGSNPPLIGPTDYTEYVYEEEGLIIHNFTIDNNYTPPVFPDDAYTPVASGVRKVMLTPVLNPASGNQDFLITVYKDDGTLDESFGEDGRVQIDFGGQDVPTAFVWQGTQLIVGGNSTEPATGNTSFALARLNPEGSLDPHFDGDGKQLTYRGGLSFNLQRLTIQQKGDKNRLYAVGDEVIAAYILEDEGTLSCSAGKLVATDKGACSAVVTGVDPVVSPAEAVVNYTLTGATTGVGTGSVSGMTFNKGLTTVTYTLASNPAQTCTFTITVEDKEAPVISHVSASVTSIWPPNHKMVDVVINYSATDNCGASISLSVSSNEPQATADPGDQSPDWLIVDNHRIKLRAERLGSGNGRTYTVTVTATDEAGNTTAQRMISIHIPKSMGKAVNPAVVNKGERNTGNTLKGLKAQVLSNPSCDKFTLLTRSNSHQPLQLRVMDAQGRTIENRSNLSLGTLQLGSRYQPGIYFLQVRQGSENVTLTLVKACQ